MYLAPRHLRFWTADAKSRINCQPGSVLRKTRPWQPLSLLGRQGTVMRQRALVSFFRSRKVDFPRHAWLVRSAPPMAPFSARLLTPPPPGMPLVAKCVTRYKDRSISLHLLPLVAERSTSAFLLARVDHCDAHPGVGVPCGVCHEHQLAHESLGWKITPAYQRRAVRAGVRAEPLAVSYISHFFARASNACPSQAAGLGHGVQTTWTCPLSRWWRRLFHSSPGPVVEVKCHPRWPK